MKSVGAMTNLLDKSIKIILISIIYLLKLVNGINKILKQFEIIDTCYSTNKSRVIRT